MNELIVMVINGKSFLDLYSKDDDGCAFLRGNVNTSFIDYNGSHDRCLTILAKKLGPMTRLTESERQRCKDLIEESEEEEEDGEWEEKNEKKGRQVVPEEDARSDINNILGRYNVDSDMRSLGVSKKNSLY